MINYKIKTSFLSLERSKEWAIFKIFILMFAENCLLYNAIHDFYSMTEKGVLIQSILIVFEALLETFLL